MKEIRFRVTTLMMTAVAAATLAAAAVFPAVANAEQPWPEPPSCSNETLSCTSIEDMVAYECFFENPESPFHFCDDPFELFKGSGERGLVAPGESEERPGRALAARTRSR